MIHVSEQRLSEVEYLIDQSIQGNHILFDPEAVREALLSAGSPEWLEECYSVEHHLEHLMEQPSFEAKRAYLDQLDSDTYRKVVKTYFNIVENSLYETLEVTH